MNAGFGLTLFVSGASELSSAAIVDARRLCDEDLDHHDLKVVDLHDDPITARDAGVFAAPTLLMHGAGPARRVTGTLSDTSKVLSALGLSSGAGHG
jgi:circadian clock protein KaiB